MFASAPVEMAFGADISRDEAWECSIRALFEQYSAIVEEPDALPSAANGLFSAGSVNSVAIAEQCVAWAREHYPSHGLAVATCRWWTAGEEDPARLAPYRVINSTLRPTGRKIAASLELVMPAVCLLAWALENLPKAPELARKRAAVYRVVPWVFPSPQHYDPKSHFREGTVMTAYDFRAACRSLSIAANPNFSKPRWVGEDLQDAGHYFLMDGLLPCVSLAELLIQVKSDPSRSKGHIEGTSYGFDLPASTVDLSNNNQQLCSEVSAATDQLLLKNRDSGQVIRAFPTPNFSTHFVIENALTAYVAPLSYFPEEDEVLFPPLSRFLIREVEKNFPRNPDKVTLLYLSPDGNECPTPVSEP